MLSPPPAPPHATSHDQSQVLSSSRPGCARAAQAIFGRGVWPDTDSVNRHYGGRTTAVTNVFFTHGVEDPWQRAGVTHSLGPTTPVRPAALVGPGM